MCQLILILRISFLFQKICHSILYKIGLEIFLQNFHEINQPNKIPKLQLLSSILETFFFSLSTNIIKHHSKSCNCAFFNDV